MNTKEITKLLQIINATFPNFPVTPLKVEVWELTLGDLPSELVFNALKQILNNNETGFAPPIATIRKVCLEMIDPSTKTTAAEGWEEVEKAIRNYGGYREVEAYESMSPIVKRTVKALNWQEICQSEKLSVTKGQFMNMFDQFREREKQDKLIPDKMKTLIAGFAKDMELITDGKN